MDKLHLFRKRVGCIDNKGACLELYDEFFKIYAESHDEDKEKFSSQFAKAYVELLEKTNGTDFLSLLGAHNDSFIEKTKSFVLSLSSSIHNSIEAELVFIEFLKSLLSLDTNKEEQELLKKYNLFIDLVESNSWLFELKDKNSVKLFKISKILEISIDTFEIDEQHLVQIALALQIFNAVPSQDDRNSEALFKIKEIASTYNIKILEMLAEGAKLHGSEPYKNFLLNGSFICISNNTILIRNTNKEYFDYSLKITEEKNKNHETIAYYVEQEVKQSQKIVNFDCAMQNLLMQEKLSLLYHIFTTKSFNIFYQSIIIDANSNKFIGLVNPFAHNDSYIISNELDIQLNEETATTKFISLIKKEYPFTRTQALYYNGTLDVLNLDFLLGFIQYVQIDKKDYVYLSKFIDYLNELESNPSKDFLQNVLISLYFDSLHNDFSKIIPSLKNYYKDFVMKFLLFNNDPIGRETEHEESQILIFPYKFYIPFINCYENKFIEHLNNLYECDDFKLSQITTKQETDTKKHVIEGHEIDHSFTIQNLQRNIISISELRSIRSNKSFVSIKKSKIILDDNAMCFLDIHVELCNLQEIFTITYNEEIINCQKFEKVLDIIKCIGINKKVLDFFGGYKEFQKDRYSFNLERFKLLWHIQVYCQTNSKLQAFYQLVLDKHHSAFLKENDIYKNYFTHVQALLDDNESLVISKNTMSDISTLSVIEAQESGLSRDLFKLTQTAEGVVNLSRLHTKQNNIKTIYFLTDNIAKGGSTEKMLRFHFCESEIENTHGFIEFTDKHFLKSFLNSEMNNIKVLCLFCGSEAKENLNATIVNKAL